MLNSPEPVLAEKAAVPLLVAEAHLHHLPGDAHDAPLQYLPAQHRIALIHSRIDDTYLPLPEVDNVVILSVARKEDGHIVPTVVDLADGEIV